MGSTSAGPISPKAFTAGFGAGISSNGVGPFFDPSASAINKIDAGISIKEGISIPLSIFPAE
jgi:hypothetical protein